MIKGFCSMACDIIHPGHIIFLQECKCHCDWLVVGVMTDDCIERYKYQRPIMTYEERAATIKGLKYVDEVIAQKTFEYPIELLDEIKPDIIFDSTEHKRYVPPSIERMLVKYIEGISSSQIKERIIETSRSRRK